MTSPCQNVSCKDCFNCHGFHYLQVHIHYTVKLWSLEPACLEHQGSLELVRRSWQFPYTFDVKIYPRLEQRWLEQRLLELSNSKHGPQGDFFM